MKFCTTMSYAVDALAADDATIDAINSFSVVDLASTSTVDTFEAAHCLHRYWCNSWPVALAIYTEDRYISYSIYITKRGGLVHAMRSTGPHQPSKEG
jgi:hypothetical protein